MLYAKNAKKTETEERIGIFAAVLPLMALPLKEWGGGPPAPLLLATPLN